MPPVPKTIQPLALFLPEIRAAISAKDYAGLRRLLKDIHPVDLAEGWGEFSEEEQDILFGLLDTRPAVELFEELENDQQQALLGRLQDDRLSRVVAEMHPDEKAKMFRKLPERAMQRMRAILKKEVHQEVEPILPWPPNTVGRLMNTRFFTLRKNWSARETLERLTASLRLHRIETIHALYVTDDDGKLLGGLTVRRLLAAPSEMRIEELMSPVGLIRLRPQQDQEEAARLFTRYDLVAAPVVNGDNKLIGIVSIDDIVDVIHSEASEDIARLAGTEAREVEERSVLRVARLRSPWLLATFAGGLITSSLLALFEGMLSRVVAAATFIPVVLGMGNNVGVQSATIAVRAMALGRFDFGRLGSSLWREFRVAALTGLLYAALLFGVAQTRYGADPLYRLLGVAVGLGIWGAMAAAGMIGLLIPVFARMVKVDPAVVAGPVVATSTDIVSLTVYLAITALLLR